MSCILNLESFDTNSASSCNAAEGPPATYDDGYQAGRAAAQSELMQEQAVLRATVVEALSDSSFGFQEAQAHFLTGLKSYVDVVLDAIVPAALAPALHLHLTKILTDGIAADAGRPIQLRVPSDQMDAISEVIADLALDHVDLTPDNNLSDHAAFVCGPAGETSLDLDAALQAIRDHSAVLLHAQQEVS